MDGVGWGGGFWCVNLGGRDPIIPTQTHDGFLARLLGLMGRRIRSKE